MNTATPLDAALTALTVLAEHPDDGFTVGAGRLRTGRRDRLRHPRPSRKPGTGHRQ